MLLSATASFFTHTYISYHISKIMLAKPQTHIAAKSAQHFFIHYSLVVYVFPRTTTTTKTEKAVMFVRARKS
jgi:hypothetical protein